MAFMQPQVYFGEYFAVETTAGTEIVPEYMVNRTADVTGEDLLNYLEGKPCDSEANLERKEGWLARMTAPGYLDCTDWTAHDTEKEAIEYLDECYGEGA